MITLGTENGAREEHDVELNVPVTSEARNKYRNALFVNYMVASANQI